MTPEAEAKAKREFREWCEQRRAIYPDPMAEERLLLLWQQALDSGKRRYTIHQPFMSMSPNRDPLHFQRTYTRKQLEGAA